MSFSEGGPDQVRSRAELVRLLRWILEQRASAEHSKDRLRRNELNRTSRSNPYTTIRVLPGEDAGVYRKLVRAMRAQFKPCGPVEEILVDQIIGEAWRLKRFERAERAYLNQVIDRQLERVARSLSADEEDYLWSAYGVHVAEYRQQQSAHPKTRDPKCLAPAALVRGRRSFSRAEIERIEVKLSELGISDCAALDSLVPPSERTPSAYLSQGRRVTLNAYLAYVATLEDVQRRRGFFTSSG